MQRNINPPLRRRDLLSLIGVAAGSAAMYQAMTSLGFASESGYKGRVKLEGDPKGATVLILGAGLAGMTAALELRQAGYKVRILEYNQRSGGRNWTLRGGDSYTELGGATQKCGFDDGLYINPGPWRIPYQHSGLLDYCKRLGVKLEPFQQANHNAYLHSSKAFGGKPQRVREIQGDFQGHISELLAKAAQKGKLNDAVATEDQEMLLEALKSWGMLDNNYAYKASVTPNTVRGCEKDPGGGIGAAPIAGQVLGLSDILSSRLWIALRSYFIYELQATMFEPVGGMDMIGKAFTREVGDLITHNAKVTKIQQDGKGVTVTYENVQNPGETQQATAQWCICTIPLTILSQIEMNVSPSMLAAINAVPYAASVKVGLQFKRRFWEEDENIFGGVSYTDLPISQISYPSTDFNTGGKGVLLGCYTWNGPDSYELTAKPPDQRVKLAVDYGAQIHLQYKQEFENGISVAWHRSPFTLGAAGDWTDEARKQHYYHLCKIDGRIVLAGEHCSYLPAWQEGAILSSLDAITRLHKRVLAG
ncbi:NAD(P)/FAD-dependent oxidoreductase [Brucella sp. IR073]|uniref:NAD(P)/FAD-dependent oxidoreductase n=1 Tax=unclassified Brucella TaxID=2632610 RepID=UPI003B984BBB